MTQDERWLARYNEVKSFIEANHRNPSKYYDEEKLMVHFLKRGRKLMNAGELQDPRNQGRNQGDRNFYTQDIPSHLLKQIA